MDPKLLDLINTISVFLFVMLAILVGLRIFWRYLRYRKQGLKVPELLPRDFFLILGLVIPFGGVLIFRALGVQNIREEWWYPLYVITSDIMGVAAMANWAYFEYFRIEKVKK